MVPALFVAHGAPLLAVEENPYTAAIRTVGQSFPHPRAVVVLSAHWVSRRPTVSEATAYETIYDFGGFPDALYQIRYPAPGAPRIAREIEDLFGQQGISFDVDTRRGLDHGAWVVLRLLYPDANIPVIALSVSPQLSPEQQYHIGQSLKGLRSQDILIVASGGTVHNLGRLNWHATAIDDWAIQFDQWMEKHLTQWDLEALYHYDTLAPSARLAVPPAGTEHFVPLFYAMGAADDARRATLLHRSYRYGNLSHSLWQLG